MHVRQVREGLIGNKVSTYFHYRIGKINDFDNSYSFVDYQTFGDGHAPPPTVLHQADGLDLCSRPMVCFRAIFTTYGCYYSSKTNQLLKEVFE